MSDIQVMQGKINSVKEVIDDMKTLEEIDNELNKKCKNSGDHIDILKLLIVESNNNLKLIISNLS